MTRPDVGCYVAVTYDGTNADEVTEWLDAVLTEGWYIRSSTVLAGLLHIHLTAPTGQRLHLCVAPSNWLVIDNGNLIMCTEASMAQRWAASA